MDFISDQNISIFNFIIFITKKPQKSKPYRLEK